MADIPDTARLSELSIPGTHESGARFEPSPGLAKSQDLTIADQLAAGARYLDLHCHEILDQLFIYHDDIDEQQTFDQVLATMLAFLDKHPTETLIVSFKEEGLPEMPVSTFEYTIRAFVDMAPDRWYIEQSVPMLGDVRGKLVVLRRFDVLKDPIGIDASMWPDNASFAITHPGVALRIEDEYQVTDNDAKWSAITKNVDAAATADPATLFLTYTSGVQTVAGMPSITSVSDDINKRLDGMIASAPSRLGVLVMDHATKARIEAVAAANR